MRRPEQATVTGLLTTASLAGAACLCIVAANHPPSHESISQAEQHQTTDDPLTALTYALGLAAVIGLASMPAPGESRPHA